MSFYSDRLGSNEAVSPVSSATQQSHLTLHNVNSSYSLLCSIETLSESCVASDTTVHSEILPSTGIVLAEKRNVARRYWKHEQYYGLIYY